MKKLYLILIIALLSFSAEAQFGYYQLKFYDSVGIAAPKFKLQNTRQGSNSDSILVKTASNFEVKRIASNQLTIPYSNLTGTPTIPNYTAGAGINISSNVISNTAPSQTVVLTPANGLIVTGTYPNFTISKKRQETYTGTTIATVGTYTVTFGTAYSVAPNVQVAIQGDFASYTAVVSAKSTTGFTVKVYTLSSILSLGLIPQYSPVSGVVVDVLVTEK